MSSTLTILFLEDPIPQNGRMATAEETRLIGPHLSYCESLEFYSVRGGFMCVLCEEKLE